MDEYCDDDDDDDDDESDNVGGGDDQGQPRNNRLSAALFVKTNYCHCTAVYSCATNKAIKKQKTWFQTNLVGFSCLFNATLINIIIVIFMIFIMQFTVTLMEHDKDFRPA